MAETIGDAGGTPTTGNGEQLPPAQGPPVDTGAGTWTSWRWDGVRWHEDYHIGAPPGRDAWEWKPSPPPGHWVLKAAPTGGEDVAPDFERKERAEVIAGQYATINGQDVYVPTEAEEQALAKGLRRDDRGFYRLVNGEKVYETEIDPQTGRRFHWELEEGVRHAVFDDREMWPTVTGTPEELRKKLIEKRSVLERLRKQYANSRGDSWVVRGNILDRIAETEDVIMGINRQLGADPVEAPTHVLNAPKQTMVDPAMGLSVAISFAINDDNPYPSFQNPLVNIPLGANVMVKADITQTERTWKPGKVRSPDVMRVTWDVPDTYLSLDGVPEGGTDEFMCSNPLVLIRDFRSPTVGNTNAGRGTTSTFGVTVWQYELALNDIGANVTVRKEGDDGYFGGVIGDPTGPIGTDLQAFLYGLCMRETNCNNDRVNRHTGAMTKYQILPKIWPGWCHESPLQTPKSHPPPPTEQNADIVAAWKAAKAYAHYGSWRMVAVVWHHGPGYASTHPLAGLPDTQPVGLAKYCGWILDKAGLPMD